MFTFLFRGETMKVVLSEYNGGGLAVLAIDEHGSPYATLSVNVPGQTEKLDKHSFFLKDYSENADIAAAFLKGVNVRPTAAYAIAGFATVHAYSFPS